MTSLTWRERFLAVYTHARSTGDVAALAELLAEDLRLEDPQLPGGAGGKSDLLRLTADLAASCTHLDVRPYGPACVSPDGTVFTQRWFIEAEPAGAEPASRVHAETFESFTHADERITTVAIFVRDLTAARVPRPA